MFHLREIKNFFKLRAEDWNRAARFLNNLCGSAYIDVDRPDDPGHDNPPKVRLNFERLKEDLDLDPGDNGAEKKEVASGAEWVGLGGWPDREDSWTIGETVGTGQAAKPRGFTLCVLTGARDTGDNYILNFRKLHFDQTGRCVKVDGEGEAFEVKAVYNE